MEIKLENEQEAAVAILFCCAMHPEGELSQSHIDQLSRMLVLSARFSGYNLNELTRKALALQNETSSQQLFEQAAPLIEEDFRETLFTMIVEVLTSEGKIDESRSEIIGMAALFLQLPVERMKMMLTTYLIRNKFNVEVVHGL